MVPQTRVFTRGGERHLQQTPVDHSGEPPTAESSQGQPHCGSSTLSVNPWTASLSNCLQAEFQRQPRKKNLACSEHWGDTVWLQRSCFHRIPGFMCHGGDFPDYRGTGGIQLQEKFDETFTL